MPLTATCDSNNIVFASNMHESDRATKYYYCRHCGAEMRVVLPKKSIVKHFRHVSQGDCKYASESIKHLEAKQFFYDMYKSNRLYNKVEMESDWNGIEHNRIGDVVLYPKRNNVHPTVIEIQNSPISNEEIIDRFDDWNAFDFTPDGLYSMMWIITDNVVNPKMAGDDIKSPRWTRLLHKIYMGRIYIYSNMSVFAAHFNPVSRYNNWIDYEYFLKSTKSLSIKEIKNFNILQTISGGGKYGDSRLISRFYDKKFW